MRSDGAPENVSDRSLPFGSRDFVKAASRSSSSSSVPALAEFSSVRSICTDNKLGHFRSA